MRLILYPLIFFALISSSNLLPAQQSGQSQGAVSGRYVQQTLADLAQAAPDLVGFIAETQRYFIKVPRSSALPDLWQQRLQDAFYKDTAPACQLYGQLYLADWRAIQSKAARESFWGASFLANRTLNYFGIRHHGKPWICEQLGFCAYHVRNDPDPAAFVVFPNFEASVWGFIHTIFSGHFLARLPDGGIQVADAIQFERNHGIHYWEYTANGQSFSNGLQGTPYHARHLIYSWSGHAVNNLCIDCNRDSDWEWIQKILRIEERNTATYQPTNK
ncbi:MAG: hypothetical protein HRU12_14155 [Phaeodactylibacter sp.]|nr:hypothetical protein [Phaeodactylibacter sp.]